MLRRLFVLCLLMLLSLPLVAAEGFSIKDIAGKTHTLAGYKGRWVLVNFWATWCPPCLDEIPDLIDLHDRRKDLSVIGVALEYKDAKEIRTFVDDNLMSYPIVLGNDKLLLQFGEASVLPTTYIYNPQGHYSQLLVGLLHSPPHLINMLLLVACPILVGRFLQSRFGTGAIHA